MKAKERKAFIKQFVDEQGKVEIDELAEQLQVSQMTIRRDLTQLEAENQVIRTPGGAVPQKALIRETPYARKEVEQLQAKRKIAQKAIALIAPNSTILLDSGTTTLEVARLIKDRADLTVVTNDIKIAAELVHSSVTCIVTGGEVQADVGALYGSQAQALIESIHVDLFLLGAHAVHAVSGIMAPTLEKARMKQLMIEAARETWLLCDSSKFEQKSFAHVSELNKVEGIITDKDQSLNGLEYYHETVIQVDLVE
ncbi:DeoR/GlpR family DNA-binding transcription regulator [Shouchella lehensis]|uniref:HTH-type transcriptional regulator n=1 Tax=Shouchella lehensis G1 TaxID=1246626 RepID=A0A060M5M3_9BACI|nr:DeoR/GlpR family DNA-binding transcription regulator [Shouchella lehensis]AIC95389.1 HTH-type transcriptional regulator [Shouchella lehensis G1]RQW21193.1 DeoR/GlpR transcriptional regulator [Bacillus sp. C1-1]